VYDFDEIYEIGMQIACMPRPLKRFECCWLNAPWLIVLGVLVGVVGCAHEGENALAVGLSVALAHFVIYTLPRRWVLDLLILWIALAAFVQWWGQIEVKQWLNV
jgi:hypothetical protein